MAATSALASHARPVARDLSLVEAVYVHIPFCAKRCGYCDFATGVYDGTQADGFLEALAVEAAQAGRLRPRTLFVGGGTPTSLSPAQLQRLLAILGDFVDVPALEEFTVEANPGTVGPETLARLRAAGVGRISLGVQTFDDEGLRLLDRLHDAAQARAARAAVRAAGLDCNLDLIYGWPGQTLARWENDLAAALDLAPQHISAYNLIYEPGTPITAARDRGELEPLDDELEAEMYAVLRARLAAAGYEHYELSNFARPGRRCRHNLVYWQSGDYLALGPGAHSHLGGARYAHGRSLRAYRQDLAAGELGGVFVERLSGRARAGELLVTALRLLDGVDPDWFRDRTGLDLWAEWGEPIAAAERQGLMCRHGGRLALGDAALFVSDSVLSAFVEVTSPAPATWPAPAAPRR